MRFFAGDKHQLPGVFIWLYTGHNAIAGAKVFWRLRIWKNLKKL